MTITIASNGLPAKSFTTELSKKDFFNLYSRDSIFSDLVNNLSSMTSFSYQVPGESWVGPWKGGANINIQVNYSTTRLI